MEKARYSMWTKRKHDLNTHVLSSAANPSYGDSWEEQAFAEDAAGDLGGCIWPPRSYTCSFCRREFRSAQALGGHMNVHKRDRAILKQSPCSQTEAFPHKSIPNPFPPLEIQYQPQTCNLLYNPNFDTDHKVLASPSSPVRVLAPTTKVNTDEYRFDPCLFPIVQEQRKTILPYFPPRSNMAANKYFRVSDMKSEEKKTEIIESNSRVQREFVKADLSASLNLVVCRNPSSSSDDAEEGGASCKRRRTEATPLNFFPKQNSVHDMSHLQSPRSIDDLDLELRLGDPPKVK